MLAVAFSSDGKSILTGDADGKARLWDAATSQPVGKPLEHHGSIVSVAFSPDGKSILTGGADGGTQRLWDSRRSFLTISGYSPPGWKR